MQPANYRVSIGVTTAAAYLLLTAFHFFGFAYIVINFTTTLVLVHVAMSMLGLTTGLMIVCVLAKIRGFQQALAAAQTTCTLLVRKVAVAEKERNTAQGQRDTANTKVKTADKEKTRLKKDLRASKATSSALCLRVAGSDGERRIAKQEVAALGQRVADGTTEHNAMANELAITNNKLTAERKRVVAQEAEIAILTRHLANANIERDIAEAKLIATNEELTGQKAETAALAHCLENTASECYTAKTELAAANGEVAAKDAVIARQRLETSKRRQLLVARGHTNLVLECIVEEVQTRLKNALFHMEVQQLSGEVVKAKAARFQEEVKSLQCSMVRLQLPAFTAPNGGDAASGIKDAAAAATQDDGSTGTLSTTLSPSDTGSSSVSRSGSNGNMSNSSESGIVEPVVSAPPTPASPSPSPSHAEEPSAVIHTGPHNRPKRVRRSKKGQHHGHNRSSAKATAKKQAGLFRGYP